MRDLLPCPPCGRQGRPGQGFLAGSNTSEPRGSAPRERDHRGGDHPVPSRTRQLSPPSPRVLRREAAGAAEIFEAQGLETISAVCKAGGLSKSELGLSGEDLLNPEQPESMCNPVLQAELMNRAQVDFNVLLGLCVGHDTLALRHLEAPATVLAVKDRMLGHNPLAAVQCSGSYFNYLKTPM